MPQPIAKTYSLTPGQAFIDTMTNKKRTHAEVRMHPS